MSVTERTREIGIRMACGAKPRAILRRWYPRFADGATGIAIGLLLAHELSRRFSWLLLVNLPIVLVAVVFGIYPARKASRLDPIEALRYE